MAALLYSLNPGLVYVFCPRTPFIEYQTKSSRLRLQIETSKIRGDTRYLPNAFSKQGVAM